MYYGILTIVLKYVLSFINDVPLLFLNGMNIGLEGVKQDAKIIGRNYEGSASYGPS